MINIELSGRNGKMGRAIETLASDIDDINIVLDNPDVIIDFSHHSNVEAVIKRATELKVPVVIATTGLESYHHEMIREASEMIPVLNSANMSLGINLIAKVLREMVKPLEDGYNIEIIEKHHNQKKDAPSGTALLLGDNINAGCKTKKEYVYGRSGNNLEYSPNEMGFHAVRGGTIPGEHTVIFAGLDEVIEIKHTAYSRNIFAKGAIDGARFLLGQKPGLYNMEDVISLDNGGI
ncbi:MAG: 4-hydroxy-tetrahydrodipicolinate reductase [Anaerovoracaceae bacterium]